MKIRIANAPVSWGIMEVEGWSPPLAPSKFLDELKQAGYEGTELGPYGYLPTDPAVLGYLSTLTLGPTPVLYNESPCKGAS